VIQCPEDLDLTCFNTDIPLYKSSYDMSVIMINWNRIYRAVTVLLITLTN